MQAHDIHKFELRGVLDQRTTIVADVINHCNGVAFSFFLQCVQAVVEADICTYKRVKITSGLGCSRGSMSAFFVAALAFQRI